MPRSEQRRWRWGEAVDPLRQVVSRGGVLVIPTESSYGLAADPRSREGIDTVYRIKRRPPTKPLPVVIAHLDMLAALGVEASGVALGGLEQGWPGALSLLLPCGSELPAAAGSGHLAVRVPGHPRLVTLIERLDVALTATSANRSGEPPILDPAAALELVAGEDAMIVDDGALPGGPPSTLVRIEGGRAMVLRDGRVTRRELVELAPQLFSAAIVENPVEESR